MLHFAYGSNMSRLLMQRRCPGALAIGTAALRGWRFVITVDGYGSIVPRPGEVVHGVLWRLSPRDLAAVNAYESLDSGLYVRRILPVRYDRGQVSALVYIARQRDEGRPRPGYMALVEHAAREWQLPAGYVQTLSRWAPSALGGARRKDTGEIG
jgi:gamma-glutamylcyclotransferase (GGCT)/AIG2-like uncharacterized protein YtfP